MGGNPHTGGGHSDHRSWEGSGIHEPNDSQRGSIERDVERQIFDARQAVGAKGAGNIPAHFQNLMNL